MEVKMPTLPAKGILFALVPEGSKVPEGWQDSGIKLPVLMCKYDQTQKADRSCFVCGDGLCSVGSCGYLIAGQYVCNECYIERGFDKLSGDEDVSDIEDITGTCLSCGSLLEPVYENNGFTEPAGPSHWEISGYKPCTCGEEDYE